jgi:hypothetical protein
MTVAALFVAKGGCYYGLPGVEPWGLPDRDAREYAGPWPVVAHPPCARWGRYWFGGPSAKVRCKLGDDGGCFASALAAVRMYGGVLEHPEASHAWRAHGLLAPPKSGGWIPAGDWRGWTCCVEQGHYGHRARKATWLYAVGKRLPECAWGPSTSDVRLDDGFHSAEERRAFRSNRTLSPELTQRKTEWLNRVEASGRKVFRRLSKKERAATPPAFRDVLLDLARSVQ